MRHDSPIDPCHELQSKLKAVGSFESLREASGQGFQELWKSILHEGHLGCILSSFESLLEQDKVVYYKSAKDRSRSDEYQLPEKGAGLSQTIIALQEYVHTAVNTQSPFFLNQLYGGAHPVAVISEFVAAFMNTSMATYEIAPVATMMEKEVLNALKSLMSWNEIDGLFVPGGSYANMMALHTARYKMSPDVKQVGHNPKLRIYVSDQAHYSVQKAAHLLGFGEDAVRVIKSDEKYKMSVQDLEQQIKNDIALGLKPCMVMSTLGTTVFGALDPIAETQKLCAQYGIWHHVDAAWGGPLIFISEKIQQDLLHVNSVAYDFHKFFGAGLTKALFVTNDVQLLSQSNSCLGTEYIFHEDEDSWFDIGVKAIQCGRKVDSLTLWALWKFLGLEGMKQYVHDFVKLKDFAKTEAKNRGFELLHDPEFFNICFKVPAAELSSEVEKDLLHRQVRQSLIQKGNLYINYSSDSKNGVFFRLVLNHLRLNEDVLKKVFDIIESEWKLKVQQG